MRLILILLALASGLLSHAYAQGTYPGQLPAGTVQCNSSSSTAVAQNCVYTSVNVKDPAYAAKCDGTTDDTTAIQAALNSGALQVYLPSGASCSISSVSVPNGVTLTGTSTLSSCLKKNSATSVLLTLGNGSAVRNMCINAGLTQTAGAYIFTTSNQVLVSNIFAQGYFAFAVIGSSGTRSINPQIEGIHLASPAVGAGTCGIALVNFGGAYLNNIQMAGPMAGNQPDCGLRIDNGDTVNATNMNITLHGAALSIDPGASQSVFAAFIGNSLFDSAGTISSGAAPSCQILPSSTGNVYETTMNNVWCGLSAGSDGMIISASSGVVSNTNITGFHFNGNSGQGLHVGTAVQNLVVADGSSGGNGGNGIFIANASTHITIAKCYCRPDPARSSAPNGSFGISVAAVAADYLTIEGNDVQGNTGGSIAYAGTGTHNVIHDNPGYNPVGTGNQILVGVSPATITAGPTPETHYVNQGATNTATVGKGGHAVATLVNPSTFYVVELGPNESYTVTWTTTQPSFVRDVH